MLTEGCPYCEGKGYIKSKTTICAEILRQLRRDGHSIREDYIIVSCNPEIADLLVTVEQQYIEEMEKRVQKKIVVQSKKRFHHEKFEIAGRQQPNEPRRRDDEEEAPPPKPTPAVAVAPPPDGEDEVPDEPPEGPVASNPEEP
jgi:hypothetical protein